MATKNEHSNKCIVAVVGANTIDVSYARRRRRNYHNLISWNSNFALIMILVNLIEFACFVRSEAATTNDLLF